MQKTSEKKPPPPKQPKKPGEPDPNKEGIDIDDAMIEEPKDDAFQQGPKPKDPSGKTRK